MFPLWVGGANTRKHFSVFQKTSGNGFGCKTLSVFSQYGIESNRPVFEFKLCHKFLLWEYHSIPQSLCFFI